MFWNILHLESQKVFGRWLLWLGLVIAVTPLLIFLLVGFNTGTIPARFLVWPGGVITALAFANGFSPGYGYAVYLLVVVVGMVTAQEYSWRTMQLWLSHGIPRPLLLSSKFLLAIFVALLTTLVFVVVGATISMILAYQLHGSVDFSHANVAQMFLSCLRTAYGMLPYVALSLLVAVMTRSAAAAIGTLVLFMLAVELPLSFLLPSLGENYAHLAQFLPAGLAQTMNAQNYITTGLPVTSLTSISPLNLPAAVICIAVYTLLLFSLSLWIFQRQNLTN